MQSFLELNLNPKVLRAINDLGYEAPSPIQAAALPLLLGKTCDFLGLAATGTGKTAAFTIPLLERIDAGQRSIQGLILCPTRELAMQVTEQVNLLGKYMGISALSIYGGASYIEQHRGLHDGVPIIVGTPGRICDHIRRGTLKLDKLKVMILDEADEMISMGFKDELTAILDALPGGQANTWLFSATMSSEVRRVADTYLKNPEQVQINRTELVPTAIEQRFYVTQESNKPEVLRKLIDAADDFYGIVFCQTKSLVTDLSQYLLDRGYRVDSLHGDKSQSAREVTMKSFRERKIKMLICTDVAARGLDVKDVTHVINYSIPRELDNYVHRIGRTARCGKSGIAMNLIAPRQRYMVAQIERLTKSKLIEGVVPSRKELGTKKVASLLSKFQEQGSFQRAVEAMGTEWKTALGDMSPEEIAGRFLALTFPDIFNEQRESDKVGLPSQVAFEANARERSDRGGPRSSDRGGHRSDRGGPRSYDRGGPRSSDRGAPRFERDRGRKWEGSSAVPSEKGPRIERVSSDAPRDRPKKKFGFANGQGAPAKFRKEKVRPEA